MIVDNERKLCSLLQKHGIDVNSWGKGEAKTVRHLFEAIESGETTLEEENGLIRKVAVVAADIIHTNKAGKTFKLIEEKQIFSDGRKRKRNLPHSMTETVRPREDIEKALQRGIKEELKVDTPFEIRFEKLLYETVVSPSYPGLRTKYVIYRFKVIFSDEHYKKAGYIEVEKDLTTYFVWQKI